MRYGGEEWGGGALTSPPASEESPLAKVSYPLAAATHSEKSKLPKYSANTKLQSGAFLGLLGKRKLLSAGILHCENVILILSEGLIENAGKRELRDRARLGFPGASV